MLCADVTLFADPLSFFTFPTESYAEQQVDLGKRKFRSSPGMQYMRSPAVQQCSTMQYELFQAFTFLPYFYSHAQGLGTSIALRSGDRGQCCGEGRGAWSKPQVWCVQFIKFIISHTNITLSQQKKVVKTIGGNVVETFQSVFCSL